MKGLTERELFLAHGLTSGGEDAPLPEEPTTSVWDHPIWARIERVILRLDEPPWWFIHWIWQGAQGHSGPEYRADQQYVAVHRYVWEACNGESLGDDETLRNTCGRRRCVFPEHWAKTTRSGLVRALAAERVIRGQSTSPSELPT